MDGGTNEGFNKTKLTTQVVMTSSGGGIGLRAGDSEAAVFSALERSDGLASMVNRNLILRFARIDQLVTATGQIHAGKGSGEGFPLEATLIVKAVEPLTGANWIAQDQLLWREVGDAGEAAASAP